MPAMWQLAVRAGCDRNMIVSGREASKSTLECTVLKADGVRVLYLGASAVKSRLGLSISPACSYDALI